MPDFHQSLIMPILVKIIGDAYKGGATDAYDILSPQRKYQSASSNGQWGTRMQSSGKWVAQRERS